MSIGGVVARTPLRAAKTETRMIVRTNLTMDARLPVGEIPAKASRPGFFLKVDILLLLLRMTSCFDKDVVFCHSERNGVE